MGSVLAGALTALPCAAVSQTLVLSHDPQGLPAPWSGCQHQPAFSLLTESGFLFFKNYSTLCWEPKFHQWELGAEGVP